jgi:RNA polymerase sigma-70 factor (ECF subfamily)
MSDMGDSSAIPRREIDERERGRTAGSGAPEAIAAMLAARAARGDVAAFEGLYRQHAGLVYATCLRLCGNPSRAEELAQDAFVRAWRGLAGFKGGTFAAWIRRIALNVALDDRRAASGAARPFEDAAAAELVPAPAARPAERLDLERAIARLPHGARTVFVLYEIEGLAHQEIAGLLGVAEATSKTQLHRARMLLREALTP